jgi:hypothetical protein
MPDIDGEPISDSFNARIIAEFRTNHGRVGGPCGGYGRAPPRSRGC